MSCRLDKFAQVQVPIIQGSAITSNITEQIFAIILYEAFSCGKICFYKYWSLLGRRARWMLIQLL